MEKIDHSVEAMIRLWIWKEEMKQRMKALMEAAPGSRVGCEVVESLEEKKTSPFLKCERRKA